MKNQTATLPKQAYVNALRAFISQRSGLDSRNYDSRTSLMGDYRPILKHGKQAREMLNFVEFTEGISAQDLVNASERAFAGRLSFVEKEQSVAVQYVTGQYFCTEYRAAACAVLASVLWNYWRTKLPIPGQSSKMRAPLHPEALYDGLSAGDYIRKQAQNRFGRGMAKEWFN